MTDTDSKTPKKIAVIDDEFPIVRMLKIRLEAHGFQVLVAYDGKGGLNLVQTENPDLILLDLVLPELDGFQLCQLLKNDEKYKNIPIVILTARSAEEVRKISYELGADAYLTKPFEPEILMNKIQELLSQP